jgi:hypothetical protein
LHCNCHNTNATLATFMKQRTQADKYHKVVTILERKELDAQEKLILIDIVAREPEPTEEETKHGVTEVTYGYAIAPAEKIEERTGISKRTVDDRTMELRKAGFLKYIPAKGSIATRYRVVFPKPRKRKEKGALLSRLSRSKTLSTVFKKKKKVIQKKKRPTPG